MVIRKNIIYSSELTRVDYSLIHMLWTLSCHLEQCVFLIRNTYLWWVPNVPSKVTEALSCADFDDNEALKEYRRERVLVLGKTPDCDSLKICYNGYSNTFIEYTLTKQIENGLLQKRLIPSSKFKTLQSSLKRQHVKEGKSDDLYIKHYGNDNGKHQQGPPIHRLRGKRCPLPPRETHSTNVAPPTDNWFAPFHGANHDNHLARNFSPISIPETDTCNSAPSLFASSTVSRYRSIINKNVQGHPPARQTQNVQNSGSEVYAYSMVQTAYPRSSARESSQIGGMSPTSNPGQVAPIKPPRHPDYADRSNRMMSFGAHSWPLSGKPDPNDFANWGFFATGTLDLVRCFQCGIGLKDWITVDDVMTEHIKHAYDCVFLLQKLGQQELLRLKNAILYPDLDLDHDDNASSSDRTTPATVTLPYAIRNPRYQTMESRIASFNGLPPTVTQTHQQLAVAGFFYTGAGDICRCFTCDGGLQRWVPEDDPITEHAKYFPTCSYIKHLKGDDFVRRAQEDMNVQGSAAGPNPNETVTSNTTSGITKQMGRLGLKGGSAAHSNPNEGNDPLRTPEAKAVLQMGYEKHVVLRAIEELKKQRRNDYTADDISNEILDNLTESHTSPSNETTDHNYTDEDPSDVVAENKKLKSLMRCMLCLTGETNILCLPCTHHRMCHGCAKDVTHCPVCNKRIQDKIRTYMA